MILIGKKITEEKIEVQGAYISGSVAVETTETNLPERPNEVTGKKLMLYVNPVTKQAYYDYVDRPLNENEKIAQLEAQNAQMLLVLVEKGLM
jgi:hypothetical protein